MTSPLVVLSIVLAGCGSSDVADVGEAPASTFAEHDPQTTGVAVAPAAATAGDTFDEAFYEPDGGNFPALDDPEMIAAANATWLDPDDVVMGIVSESGEAMAFPVDQMAYHHVANTRLAGEPFVVTY